jgi:DNA-binding NarL/FixJ family response regulator
VETHNSFLRTIGQSIGKGLATLEAPSMSKLPPRRRQTLEKILLGLSDEEIAVELGLSKDTVRGHIKELFRDFHVSSRAELMAHVLRYSRSLPEDLY